MKPVLILGLFQNEEKPGKNILTAEERVAGMLRKNNIEVISSSHLSGKFSRLFDSIATLIKRKNDYDIAIVPLFGTWPSFLWQEIATRLLKFYNKKIILGIHGGSIPERVDKGARRFLKALNRADVIVSPSAFMQDYFAKKGFTVRIIQNPIDIAQYNFVEKEIIRPRIIWMRAFTDVYNPAMAIRVAERMAKKYEDFKMVMAGKDGPEKDIIVKQVQESGLDKKITFPGYIQLEQKKQLVQEYDIYISTNKIDNAPVSVIEFMNMGLPVISTNVGGMPFLIEDNKTGMLVDNNDDKAMFEKICALIENTSLAVTIAKNAKKYAATFDEKVITEKWKELLIELS